MSRTSRSSAYHIKPYSSDLVLADGTPAPPTVLYTALKDEDGEVRVCAALGLVQAGDQAAMPSFMREIRHRVTIARFANASRGSLSERVAAAGLEKYDRKMLTVRPCRCPA